MVFDPAALPGGLGFRRIRSLVAERVPLVPPFRMRMVGVPFGLQHPTLVDDPEFDLDYHVRRISCPDPGGPQELAELVADLAAARSTGTARCGSSTWWRAWRTAASASWPRSTTPSSTASRVPRSWPPSSTFARPDAGSAGFRRAADDRGARCRCRAEIDADLRHALSVD